MIWERLLIILVLLVMSAGALTAVKQTHMRRVNRRTAVVPTDQPALLYCRSDTCAVCPTQARYVEQVMANGAGGNGRVILHTINVDDQPDQAQRYGVMTLPTTMLLDATGQVRQINYGLTPAHKLAQQLQTLFTTS